MHDVKKPNKLLKGAMSNFVVFVHGENYNLEVEGRVQLAGFFATRRAEAESEEAVLEIVLRLLQNEPELCNLTSVLGVNPTMNAKVAHEMPREHQNEYTGFTFYTMEDK